MPTGRSCALRHLPVNYAVNRELILIGRSRVCTGRQQHLSFEQNVNKVSEVAHF